MKYVIIYQTGSLYITENSEEVNEILRQKEGVFYVVTAYPTFAVIEKYQTVDGKIYRIDVVNM